MAEERDFQPLRARAWLQSGVVCDPYLPLDGVLYYQVHRELLGAQVVTVPGASVSIEDGESRKRMPFRRAHRKRLHWHYRCSFAQWPEHVTEGSEHWAKRLDQQHADLIDFGGRRGTVAIGSGAYKAYYMPVFYRHALHVDWYCVADRVELERLLRFCTHLGKKVSQGWGAVLRWQVDSWPEDWSVEDGSGRLMRAVYEPGAPTLYGIRPSYWHPRNQFPCRLPEAS